MPAICCSGEIVRKLFQALELPTRFDANSIPLDKLRDRQAQVPILCIADPVIGQPLDLFAVAAGLEAIECGMVKSRLEPGANLTWPPSVKRTTVVPLSAAAQ